MGSSIAAILPPLLIYPSFLYPSFPTSETDLQTVGDATGENLDEPIRTRSPRLPLSAGPQCGPVSRCCHPRIHIYPSQPSKVSDLNFICQRSHLEIHSASNDK